VSPRRWGEKLLQHSNDANNPSKPPAMTMIATVLLLNPGAYRDASSSIAVLPSGLLSAGAAVL
jgi:hypothetical protein